MRDFKTLTIWQKSHLFTLEIYTITSAFPREEAYGLISQIRRSAASVPTNIAEGCGRNSVAELRQFLTIASGSASELAYQLVLSKDLGYISDLRFKELDNELSLIRKMMHVFSAKLSE